MRRALLLAAILLFHREVLAHEPRPARHKLPRPAASATPEASEEPSPAASPTPTPTPKPARIVGKVMVEEKDGPKPGEGAVVFLEEIDPELWSAPDTDDSPMITMQDKKFNPRVLPVLVEQEVTFPNVDTIFHNVFSKSGKNTFDLGLYKNGKSKKHGFPEAGVVRIFCNIHPSMTGYVLVLQNPFWASVESDGSYSIQNVPPGNWVVKVWHERGGEASKSLGVKAGGSASADFDLDARKYKVIPHKNKLGQDYSSEGY